MDLVVGDRDRLAHTVLDLARLPFEPRPQHRQRGLGRFLSGRLAAHAVDDDEETADGIVVKAILVDRALQPRMAVPRRPQGDADLHEGIIRDRSRRGPREPPGGRDDRAKQDEPGPEEPRHGRPRSSKSRYTVSARPIREPVVSGGFDAVLLLRAVHFVVALRQAPAVHGRAERAEIDDEERAALGVAPDARVLAGDVDGGVDPHVGGVGDAAASDRHGIAHDVEGVGAGVVVVAETRMGGRSARSACG